MNAFDAAFSNFADFLDEELIGKMMDLPVSQEEDVITTDIFARVAGIQLVDKYQAYQVLDDKWTGIAGDLEMIQTEGFAATKQVNPNMVIKKVNGKEEEVQDGWVGHIIPFELVQFSLLRKEYDAVKAKEAHAAEIDAEIAEIIDTIPEDDKGDYLNDDNTAFVAKEFAAKLKEIYDDIDSPELSGLAGYGALLDEKAGKAAKLTYISEHTEVDWAAVDGSAPYAKGKVNDRMKELRSVYEFPEESLEAKLIAANKLLDEQKTLKHEAKEMAAELHLLTKKTIEELTDEQAINLLRVKWIVPLYGAISYIPYEVVAGFVKSVELLSNKYAVTYKDIGEKISEAEKSLCDMIAGLTGNDYDMQGLAEFRTLLGGE